MSFIIPDGSDPNAPYTGTGYDPNQSQDGQSQYPEGQSQYPEDGGANPPSGPGTTGEGGTNFSNYFWGRCFKMFILKL